MDQTNLYAEQQLAEKLAPEGARTWYPCDVAEIRAAIGLNIFMGVNPLPVTELYWSTHPLFQNDFPSSVMPRIRFQQLMQFLHLNDNSTAKPSGQPGYDPLHKVRPVLDNFMSRCGKYYVPGPRLTVDEAMIKYKGRLKFKVGADSLIATYSLESM